jgi:hypothetical protein
MRYGGALPEIEERLEAVEAPPKPSHAARRAIFSSIAGRLKSRRRA